MKFPIGFVCNETDDDSDDEETEFEMDYTDSEDEEYFDENIRTESAVPADPTPEKSVVQVRFKGSNISLSYYNDRFDLHCGDMVYVEGKYEGLIGLVINVSHTFKIRLSVYKRVIALVDTNVRGRFYLSEARAFLFDPDVIPFEKVIRWFKAPAPEEEETEQASGDEPILLCDFQGLSVSPAVYERGKQYYLEDKVLYISLNSTHGKAIVEGSEIYELEFEYSNGEVKGLVCDCFCSFTCKHEVAVLLQLREILDDVENKYADEYRKSEYLAAIYKPTLLNFAINNMDDGELVLK